MENKIVVINGVRGYEASNKTAYLNLEDVARGLGFEREKNGKMYVMWDRVKKYLKEFSFHTSVENEFIPENIFYKLCMKANNEVARKFQDLVCDEILPQIRQTGGYIHHNEEDTDEEIMARALLVAQKTIERKNNRIKELENKVEKDKPKIEYHDKVLQPSGLLTTTQIAKDLGMSARKLNEMLNDLGIIYKQSNTWFFYEKYQNRIPECADYVVNEHGQLLKWTELGRKWIIDLLKQETNLSQ